MTSSEEDLPGLRQLPSVAGRDQFRPVLQRVPSPPGPIYEEVWRRLAD